MISKIKNFFINGFNAVKIRNRQDIKNIYHGNVALVYTFWILPLLLILPFEILLRILDHFVDPETNGVVQNVITALIITGFVVYVTLNIFCTIAAWRSSNQYKGRKLWPRLTKFLIVFSYIIIILCLLFYFAIGVSEVTKRQVLASQSTDIWSSSTSEDLNLTAS